MMTKSQKEYKIAVVKGLIGAIPYFGTIINEVFFESRSRIKQTRVNNFIEEFSKYIQNKTDLEEDINKLDKEKLGDVFEELIVSVSKTSSHHKKDLFKKILLNQLKSSDIDTDESIRFINITNELTKSQFEILTKFNALSDNLLKYRVQIVELGDEKKNIERDIKETNGKYLGADNSSKKLWRLEERRREIPKLIGKKRKALEDSRINPNSHKTFNLTRENYLTEVQDLIAKGLLFDFALRSSSIDPFLYFGVTSLGRSYLNYVLE